MYRILLCLWLLYTPNVQGASYERNEMKNICIKRKSASHAHMQFHRHKSEIDSQVASRIGLCNVPLS